MVHFHFRPGDSFDHGAEASKFQVVGLDFLVSPLELALLKTVHTCIKVRFIGEQGVGVRSGSHFLVDHLLKPQI
jgi:hypothetical protein